MFDVHWMVGLIVRLTALTLIIKRAEGLERLLLPYDNFLPSDLDVSYVIDNKRFIDSAHMRCLKSTALDDPSEFEPKFTLIRPNGEVQINATVSLKQIMQSGFEPRNKTIVVIHGRQQSYPETLWLHRTRDLFRENGLVGRQNLWIMDYRKAANETYDRATALTSAMGAFLANFLNKLYQLGQQPMDLHVIGHSLGAHVAGFAGKRLRPKVGRITGIDPAFPCFSKETGNTEQDRLNASDAYMVDVLHYDGGILGHPEPVGQIDVYVNGGSSQPGCNSKLKTIIRGFKTLLLSLNRTLSESHTRSTEVATTQLSPINCQLLAYECQDYKSFQAGECGLCDAANVRCHMVAMEYQDPNLPPTQPRTSETRRKFYISTSAADPFCLQHYQILVKFQPSPELALQAKRNKWRIQMEAFDSSGVLLSEFTITNQMSPSVFSYLYLLNSQPIRIKSARVKVLHNDGLTDSLSKHLPMGQVKATSWALQLLNQIFSVEVNFMSHVNLKARQSLSTLLCPVGYSTAPTNSIDATGWLKLDECH